MSSIKKVLAGFILLVLVAAPGLAAIPTLTQGVFTTVQGKVEIKTKKGHKTKKAQKDLTVFEGDRIITQENSSATLRLFDGSTLDISPKTEFILSKLQKPTEKDKVISFKLIVGKLLAAVEKLTTSKSSFEIEAGGVVCGVRGTNYSVQCDGASKPQVLLHVFSGTVYTIDAKGNQYFFHPGPPIKFIGSVIDQTPPAPSGNGVSGLQDLSDQFQAGVNLNQGKTLGASNTNVITIKPVVGN